jgi:hypothetical protein
MRPHQSDILTRYTTAANGKDHRVHPAWKVDFTTSWKLMPTGKSSSKRISALATVERQKIYGGCD